jgi:hypothetical protein
MRIRSATALLRIIMRRNRFPTLTVHADPRAGLPSELFHFVGMRRSAPYRQLGWRIKPTVFETRRFSQIPIRFAEY